MYKTFNIKLFGLLLLLCIGTTLQAQILSIKGTVKGDDGEPLIGVSVGVKGEPRGTITDMKGNYSINAKANDVLIFSFIGLTRQEIPVNNRKFINVEMKEDNKAIKEVVVVGYQVQEKKDVTGSVSSFRPAEDLSTVQASMDQLLQGQISGIQIQSSGTPGGQSSVRVRGVGSINGNSEPLYVIDGVPMDMEDGSEMTGLFGSTYQSPLTSIDPNDIESVDVLKDAAAAAIYGSRATNGVIIITTKRGKGGKTDFTFSASFGVQQIRKFPKMANSDLYLTVMNEAIGNYNRDNGYTSIDPGFQKLISDPRGANYAGDTKWYKLPFNESPFVQNYSFSIRGGNQKTKFYTNIAYFNQEGLVRSSRLQRANARVNLDHSINKNVSFGIKVGFTHTINNRVPDGTSSNSFIMRSLGQRPYDTPYREDGSYYVGGVDLVYHNVEAMVRESESNYKIYSANASINLDWTICKGLVYRPTVNVLYNTNNDLYWRSVDFPKMESYNGYTRESRATSTRLLLDHTLTYKNRFVDKRLDFTALFGQSFERYDRDYTVSSGWDFPTKEFMYIRSAAKFGAVAYATANSLVSHFGRINLGWDDKYLVTAAVRTDGSSKFPKDGRWGVFPSVSGAWRISQEEFMPQSKVLNDLKLRVSWGKTGDQSGVGNFTAQRFYGAEAPYNGKAGLNLESPGNRDLRWEKADQVNLGIDANLFNGRIDVSLDGFIKNTKDLLFSKPMQATYGYQTKLVNIGRMQNKGIEFSIKTQNIKTRNFTWTTSFNVTGMSNEIKKLMEGNLPVYVGDYHILEVGQPIASFYLYNQLGIYQYDNEVPKNLYDKGVRAGDIKYELDSNGDPVRKLAGHALPNVYGGMTNTFKYKDFDLSFLFSFQTGNKIFSSWRYSSVDRMGLNQANILEESALNRWTEPGSTNVYPRAIYNSNHNNLPSNRFLEDGSFLKLNNITLGYNIPRKKLRKIRFKDARIYVTGQNVFVVTKYSGMDPEVSTNITPREMGQDNGATPTPRSVIVGLNVKF